MIEKVGVSICFILCLVISFIGMHQIRLFFMRLRFWTRTLESNGVGSYGYRIELYEMKLLCFSRFSEAKIANHGDSDTLSLLLGDRVRRLILNHAMELLYSE